MLEVEMPHIAKNQFDLLLRRRGCYVPIQWCAIKIHVSDGTPHHVGLIAGIMKPVNYGRNNVWYIHLVFSNVNTFII
jgi:hypothetical protein